MKQVTSIVTALFLAVSADADERRGTAEEAQDMVAHAIAYYDEMGAEAALAKFNANPEPEFLDRDLYIFVAGPDSRLAAHAADPSLLGTPAASFVDETGKRHGEEMWETATEDGVWVDYRWLNPATGKVENKSSWVVRHDDHVFGVGIYTGN